MLLRLHNLAKRKASRERSVQSCIVAASFPRTLGELRTMLKANQGMRENATDLDLLLRFKPGYGLAWTTPRWMTDGDILFFYQSLSGKKHADTLLRAAHSDPGADPAILQVLERNVQQIERYAGSIFACAMITNRAAYERSDKQFKSRFFAPIDPVHTFPEPLPASAFERVVKIQRASSITGVSGEAFDQLKALLAERNKLPDFLQTAHSRDIGFHNVAAANWRQIACLPEKRFIHETQLRAYLLDYLLTELKDPGTRLLEECQCFRDGKQTGIADYMVQIHGTWLPVEAKLNIRTESSLPTQVKKYLHIDTAKSTQGRSKDTQQAVQRQSVCVVADQSGLYMTRDGEFVDCSEAKPWIEREQLAAMSAEVIRERLRAHC